MAANCDNNSAEAISSLSPDPKLKRVLKNIHKVAQSLFRRVSKLSNEIKNAFNNLQIKEEDGSQSIAEADVKNRAVLNVIPAVFKLLRKDLADREAWIDCDLSEHFGVFEEDIKDLHKRLLREGQVDHAVFENDFFTRLEARNRGDEPRINRIRDEINNILDLHRDDAEVVKKLQSLLDVSGVAVDKVTATTDESINNRFDKEARDMIIDEAMQHIATVFNGIKDRLLATLDVYDVQNDTFNALWLMIDNLQRKNNDQATTHQAVVQEQLTELNVRSKALDDMTQELDNWKKRAEEAENKLVSLDRLTT